MKMEGFRAEVKGRWVHGKMLTVRHQTQTLHAL